MNPKINLHLGDCMPAMKDMEDNSYDLAIVDPPYGIGDFNIEKNNSKISTGYKIPSTKKYKKIEWNKSTPNQEYFNQLYRVAKNTIIFGFQHYIKYLNPENKGIIVHDFVSGGFLSHADLAITNLQKRVTKFSYRWSGFLRENNEPTDNNRVHPCEKPVALYKWLLKNYAKEGDKILDTHGGSMSIAIACHDMKFDLDLWEIDEDYYKAGVKRFNQHKAQLTIF